MQGRGVHGEVPELQRRRKVGGGARLRASRLFEHRLFAPRRFGLAFRASALSQHRIRNIPNRRDRSVTSATKLDFCQKPHDHGFPRGGNSTYDTRHEFSWGLQVQAFHGGGMSALPLATPEPALRVLLVDDHAIVREGLMRLLDGPANRWELAEAVTGFQALEMLRQSRFDLALVDLSMPGMTGLELVRRIKTEFSGVRVLVLSMHSEEQYAIRAFKAGADGYVTKDLAAIELVSAVNKVAAGGAYVTPSLAEHAVRQLNGSAEAPRHAQLTNREFDILRRVAAGQRLTEIGDALHLSVKTVSTHKTRILEKLQISSTAELIRYALENSIA
ncbi:response regulator transcription factor [Variovorax sp. J22R133]|uniref:response regulator n=1 Tax=Variovorax brevis TaxID=3053503 RepID=UPI0025751222|nr:response regulator transcription factor [Variovorax sp. J22R133]MDM0110802.1 response regulator transcription factor [Variovorax sp. J22R133]